VSEQQHKSTQVVRSILVTPKGHPEGAFLLVEIDIDCAVCGGFTAHIAGHHVAALVAALQDVVAEHGKLAGSRSGESLKLEWEGMAPGPGGEQMN
jgi:hypothetical protein